jgi:protein tyrosine/serine phosphatase
MDSSGTAGIAARRRPPCRGVAPPQAGGVGDFARMTDRPCPALVLAAILAASACSHPADTPGSAATARPAGVPIDNFAEVAPGIFRGAQPDADGFRALKERGVRTIVNLRGKHDDRPVASPLGLDVVDIPMSATVTIAPPTDDEVRAFLAAVLDPAKRPVFVHCAAGKDRTGTMCALYRIEVDGWTPEKAYEEMKSFGWHDEMYPALGAFVRGYAAKGLATKPR